MWLLVLANLLVYADGRLQCDDRLAMLLRFRQGQTQIGVLSTEFVNDFETPGDFSLVRAAVAFC